ncbi:MAG TPA: FadR/GntR family transcriptional regulator [Rhizobiaceae bacterium]|nr:FadR/GntR family transcriptional regulator [Rhizobiaceae bacterium]
MTALFSRIEPARTADAVCARIEDLILDGVLRVGDRLPGERELARQFDVSRPVLREALKALETRGLIATRHGGGTFVADVIGEVFSPAMTELVSGHPRAVRDYLEFRREIETTAAELAARRATADDKAMLAQIVEEMRAAHARADFAREAEIDVEFHNAVGECAHNIILLHTLRSCYRLLANGVFFNRTLIYRMAGAGDRLLSQHLAIHDAIAAGDPQAARAAAAAHIAFIEQAMGEAERADGWAAVARLRLAHRGGKAGAQGQQEEIASV